MPKGKSNKSLTNRSDFAFWNWSEGKAAVMFQEVFLNKGIRFEITIGYLSRNGVWHLLGIWRSRLFRLAIS